MNGKKIKKKKATATAGRFKIIRLVKLGESRKQQNDVATAMELFCQALALDPNYAPAHQGLANLHMEANRWELAAMCWQRVLLLKPADAMAHHNLGICHFNREHLEEAATSFEAAITRRRHFPEACRNLAVSRNMLGQRKAAFRAYLEAYRQDPYHLDTHEMLSVLMSHKDIYADLDYADYRPCFKNILRDLFAAEGFWHQGLAPFAGSQLAARYANGAPLEPHLLAADKLLVPFLEKTINVNLDLEVLLGNLRRQLLAMCQETRTPDAELLELFCALACQCFNHEFLLSREEGEKAALAEQRALLTQNPAAAQQEPGPLLACCLYGPAFELEVAGSLKRLEPKCWSKPLARLLRRTLFEPLAERDLQDRIQALASITDPISQRVRRQYERHPFPRWLNISRSGANLATSYSHFFPGLTVPAHLRRPRVLIAGCGTGQQPITIATANPGAQVEAIDLSLSSLAYAMRMADSLGVKNINFHHGDILQLDLLKRSFQHIEAVGVLHHMAYPERGWSMLSSLLEPGGTMRLALYSQLGRAGVVRARAMIAERGILADDQSMLDFRRELIHKPELQSLKDSLMNLDFFSTSTLRDLIFHVQEHRITLLELDSLIKSQGLDFLGFEMGADSIRDVYHQAWPEDRLMIDLNHWHELERERPHLFREMYRFWVTKPIAG